MIFSSSSLNDQNKCRDIEINCRLLHQIIIVAFLLIVTVNNVQVEDLSTDRVMFY